MKHIKNLLKITLLFLIFAISSCKKSNDVVVDTIVTPAPAPPLAVQNTNDVAYGADALQKFDMILPAGRTTATTKVLIIIHGGGWTGGDKADMTSFMIALKDSLPTYAFMNINYRLANAATGANAFPTQENDVKAAVDFINNNRATYNISDKISLLGASAGGHLALLQAYKYNTPKIKAVVDLYGPTDMSEMYNNPGSASPPAYAIGYLTTGSLAGTPTSNPTAFSQSSPITFVNAQSPPTIMFHGNMDNLVRFSQSSVLNTKLGVNGVVKSLIAYANEGHAYTGVSLYDTFIKTIAFLKANVQ